jgi:cell division protein FtsI/penicillin-binding protein 2
MTRRALLATALAFPSASNASALDAAWRDEGFDPSGVNLLLDGPDPARAVSNWANAVKPLPCGSLLKPFAALAYAAGHSFRYPAARCSGAGCWLPSGHGPLSIEGAIAQSCNFYFRALARELSLPLVAETALRFGLPAPPAAADADSYWGLGSQWVIPPTRLLYAYRELARRAAEPGVAALLEGLRQAAAHGTASGVAAQALAKTGTGPCVHRGSNGDGYVCVLYPHDKPRYTMLLQLHGRTGREAARAAGVVLNTLLRGPH